MIYMKNKSIQDSPIAYQSMTIAPSYPPSMDPTSIEEEEHTIAAIFEDIVQEANSQAFVHIRGGQCENRIGVKFRDAMSDDHGVYSTALIIEIQNCS